MTKAKELLSKNLTIFRIVFGVVWAIDAIFKWLPSFQQNFTDSVMMAASGQPHWLAWFFNIGMSSFMAQPHFFAILVAVVESAIALSLLLGLGRTVMYIIGMVFAFAIWALGEGFGGPYGADSTDIGAAVMYIFIFWALLLLDRAVPSWSLDGVIKKKLAK